MEQRFSEKDPNSEVLGRAIVGLEIFFPILLFLAVLLRVIFQISGFDSSIYSDFFILGLALWLSHNLLKENHYWRLSRSLSENVLGSLPIVAFFGVTHGSWIKIDRDPGFIAVAGKLFTNANQLFFHFLRVPNVAVTQYSQSAVGLGFDQLGDGRTPVQGFPGTIQLYSFLNRFFSVEGFPLLVGVLLAFFSYLLSVSILRQWTKSVLMATLIAYGFFLTIPSLYIFRGTFTESIAILYLLTIVRLLQIFNGRKIREKRRIFELINLVLIFAVLTRADAVLTLWIPTYLYFIIFSEGFDFLKGRKNKSFLWIPVTYCLAFYLDYIFSPTYFMANLHVLCAQFITGLMLLIAFFSSKMTRFFKNIFSYNLTVLLMVFNSIFLLFLFLRSIGWLHYHSNDLSKIYPNTFSAISWYGGRLLVVAYIFSILSNTFQALKGVITLRLQFLGLINCLMLITYGYDLGIAPDQPWASRRLVYFVVPVICWTIFTSAQNFRTIYQQGSKSLTKNTIRVITCGLFLTFVLNSLVQIKPFVKLEDRKNEIAFGRQVCEKIQGAQLSKLEPVFFTPSLISWEHTLYSLCPGKFYVLPKDQFPKIGILKKTFRPSDSLFPDDRYILLSRDYFPDSIQVRGSSETYLATQGSRPRTRARLFESIWIGRTTGIYQPTSFVSGFFSSESSSDGTEFAWVNGEKSTVSVAGNSDISIQSPLCRDITHVRVSGMGTFNAYARQPITRIHNPNPTNLVLTLISTEPACRLSKEDSRMSAFSVYLNHASQ